MVALTCDPGNGRHHSLVTSYRRPWWRGFRKTYVVRCRYCRLRIVKS
jgi:hypothetical protein